MLSFIPITIANKGIFQSFLNKTAFNSSELSFSNLFSWACSYNTLFTIWNNQFLFIRFQAIGASEHSYLFPLGIGNLKAAIKRLMKEAESKNEIFQLSHITPRMFDLLEASFPNQFFYEKERSLYDYVYLSKDLIYLTGKKYQAKRNHINKFQRSYKWEYIPITRKIIPECLKLYEQWNTENEKRHEQSLIEEKASTKKAFDNYEQLELKGGALLVNGKILAYSYGKALTMDTFGVHAEKCLYNINGGFAMMNYQFIKNNCTDFFYINREEDLGIGSLRQSKMSYHPIYLLEKGTVRCKHNIL